MESLLGGFINQFVQGVALRCCKMGLTFFSSLFLPQADFKNDTTSKAIHSIFKNAIKLLHEKGFIYQKDGSFDNLFYVRLAT